MNLGLDHVQCVGSGDLQQKIEPRFTSAESHGNIFFSRCEIPLFVELSQDEEIGALQAGQRRKLQYVSLFSGHRNTMPALDGVTQPLRLVKLAAQG